MRSDVLVTPGTLLGQPCGFKDAVHLGLPVRHPGRDVLNERALAALRNDRMRQLGARLPKLLLQTGIGTRRPDKARFSLGAHVLHHDTPSRSDQGAEPHDIRKYLTARSPLWYDSTENMWSLTGTREPRFMTGAPLGMSLEAIGWVLRDAPGVPAQCVSVLIGLAEHADALGRGAYPSAATLAGYARKSERQVRYDLLVLTDARLIRPGKQSLASHLPANRRPVVYDLAMDRLRSLEVQSTAPQVAMQSTAPQGTVGVQSTAPQDDRKPVAPQTATDLQEQGGVQPTAPHGTQILGCNTAQPGVQPTSYKPSINPNPAEVQTSEGGSGGENTAVPKRPKRDLNEGREDAMRLCAHLADRVEVNTGERPKITGAWLDAARLMLDGDHRREDQVHRAIDWCQDSEFWRRNVRSMPKLREQYVRLRMEADAERKRKPNGGPAPGPDRARGWMAAGRAFQEAAEQAGKELPGGR